MTRKINEQALLLGKKHQLVGIMTRAISATPHQAPTIVILNTGIVHRVGHYRMFVTLSRALARVGFDVLRFDFAGIGDSEPRRDALSPLESCLVDIDQTLDWLEQERSTSRVVLVGLCSGADIAILRGHSDPRVVGFVLMDPSIPTTARFYAQYILKHLTRLRSYVSLVLGRSGLMRLWIGDIYYGIRSKANVPPASLKELRFHNYLKQSYRNAVDHKKRILAVFTGDTTRQTYHEQMLDAFPEVTFGDQLQLEFFQSADHVFSREADRARLYDIVVDWLTSLDSQAPNRAAPTVYVESESQIAARPISL
jgi:pimeloyl-ACP methyl ester carboxylesterase